MNSDDIYSLVQILDVEIRRSVDVYLGIDGEMIR